MAKREDIVVRSQWEENNGKVLVEILAVHGETIEWFYVHDRHRKVAPQRYDVFLRNFKLLTVEDRSLRELRTCLEIAINATPSSPWRNRLTEWNIELLHYMETGKMLEKKT
jgi:hypothetical protein